ncbi:MAG: alpha-L-rhamnosidase N-terminal domain-containing protein [Verrucomicrobia bacterium]|nr:alpha-L-rhamnosidase N-terminal domain-containing protein [Verrucomicrobiota bacterium]
MRKLLILILGMTSWVTNHSIAESITPVQLQVEHLENPLGIGERTPRLSWKVGAVDEIAPGLTQSAYQILVASSEAKLARNEADLWDSGKISSNNSRLIRYAGHPLSSRSECYWKVRLWDGAGKASEWCENASWSIGLLSQSDWQGDWIAMENNHEFETSENVTFLANDPDRGTLKMRPAKYFRKEFTTKRSVSQATLYATARGIYKVEINGERVGDEYLAPGWTDYNKRLYYQTYDVTSQVRAEGANAIGATLADGWYAGYLGYALFVKMPSKPSGRGYYGETPSLIMQLEQPPPLRLRR